MFCESGDVPCVLQKRKRRREVAKQFFLDQITAEEAARQMADKVGLYLKEQG